jgi:2-oxoglutarate dehydrogenase complex dehydrogenase (E1) component-like enzyme
VNVDSQANLNSNFRVLNMTTPSNYFHAIRRQIVTNYRKPLVIMAPKTLLRHAQAISKLEDMAPGTSFQPVIGDSQVDARKYGLHCDREI